MFKQLFQSMNEMLDELVRRYPQAGPEERSELDEQLPVLKQMSDQCIEAWLAFQEKLALAGRRLEAKNLGTPAWPDKQEDDWSAMHQNARRNASFHKAQGYYQLRMYADAIRLLEPLVERSPEFVLARLYLAMSYLKSDRLAEAYRQFQFVHSLTDHAKIKSISFNAMGCIQAKQMNAGKAMELFKLAYQTDPSNNDALANLECCAASGADARMSAIGLVP